MPTIFATLTTTPCAAAADSTAVRLTLPNTFLAFHTLHHPQYLRYAHLRLGSLPEAQAAVQETFGDLAMTWPQLLRSANPAAHAWALLAVRINEHLQPNRARRHAGKPGSPQALHRLPERREDVMLLSKRMRCSAPQIAELTGLPDEAVRALLTGWRAEQPHSADSSAD